MRLHLYKRGHVWWARGSDRGVKFRKSTRHTSKPKAERVRDRWERELADPVHFRANEATVKSASERWLREIGISMNPETVRFYDGKIRHVVRIAGALKLAQLVDKPEHFVRYIETREAEGAHQHSIHRELTAWRLTLRSAARAREFPVDPRSIMPRYSSGYEPVKAFVEPETVWAAIGHLLPVRGAAVAFVIATAADFSSVPRARRSDVREADVRVRGSKTTSRDRFVPRGVEPFETFLRHALAYGKPGEELFGPWGSMARDVRAACRRADVPEFTARTLRRSAATWMVRAGVPYEIAAKFLGHGSTAMLQKVYGQLAPADAGRLIGERMAAHYNAVPVVYPAPTKTADAADADDSGTTQKHEVDDA